MPKHPEYSVPENKPNMAETKQTFTTPVGRLVAGSLYKPNTTDAEGKPLVVKHGPNINKPRVDFFFALAIPKVPGQHWASTPWGAIIWEVGHKCFPNAAQGAFAWKVEDGDSQVPNRKGRKPCEREGWAGHWILKTSGGFAPQTYQKLNGNLEKLHQADYIKMGWWVQAVISVDGNNSPNQPGVYLNHSIVCFRAPGDEIVFGPNAEDAGFGDAPLPAGVSTVPSSIPLPAPGAPGVPAVPTLAVAQSQIGVPVAALPTPIAAVPAVPVLPNPAFLNPQVPQVPVASVPVPPTTASAPLSKLTAKAGGFSYEQLLANGWNDATLVAHGLMTL